VSGAGFRRAQGLRLVLRVSESPKQFCLKERAGDGSRLLLPARFGNGMDSVSVFAIFVGSPAGAFGSLGSLPFILLFFVAMYFLLFAPQQRKQKQWQAMLAQIKSGDKVTTTGGLRGTVVTVKDDVLVLRVQPDGVKLEVVKSAIAAVTTEETTKT
jgi:preprotein translocase subunit YajC